MVHPLAVQLLVDVAVRVEQLGREDARRCTLVSCRHRMSGCCSAISRSTSAARARTELMFQEAIFSRLAHEPPLSPVPVQ